MICPGRAQCYLFSATNSPIDLPPVLWGLREGLQLRARHKLVNDDNVYITLQYGYLEWPKVKNCKTTKRCVSTWCVSYNANEREKR